MTLTVDMLIYPLYLVVLIIASIFAIYRLVILPTLNRPRDMTFEKALDIAQRIISIELELYENDIFDQQETLTNAQYENYLRDIIGHIEDAFSDNLIRVISTYMKDEEFYTWVVRLVRRYLDEKALVPLSYPEDEDML